MRKFFIILISLFILLGCSNSSNISDPPNSNNPNPPTPTTPIYEIKAFEIELTAGHYTFGVDFPYGTYNLEWISGLGNVMSSNMFSGGINQIFGSGNDGVSIKEFKNAKLTKDVILTITQDLRIKIFSDMATFDITPREVKGAEIVLESGHYEAGVDFEIGVYDVHFISGVGNVMSSNMLSGGINEVFGPGVDGLSIRRFNNLSLESGTTLSLLGVSVKLTPSK